MPATSRHISERIQRPAEEVYAYAREPAHVPEWAPGLGTRVEQVDGSWYVQTPDGPARVEFAPDNAYGVLDHAVTLPAGQTFHNPMRVLADGEGCEVVFTLRRVAGTTDEDFERDAAQIASDLARLKSLMEAGDRDRPTG